MDKQEPLLQKPEAFKGFGETPKGETPFKSVSGKKYEIVKVDDYSIYLVNGIEEREDWKVKKEATPKKHPTKLGNPIIIPVLDENDKVFAVATGLGFAGGKDFNGKFSNGEVIISKILHPDGSINQLPDERKFKVEIEHKERVIGEGNDKHNEIYTVLKTDDAKRIVKEAIIGKSGLTNVPGLQTQYEQSPKLPVAKVDAPHDPKSPSLTLFADSNQKSSFLS